jgi:transposase
LSSKNERQKIDWRKNNVLELRSQGHSQPEISHILQVSLGTVNKDLSYLRQQAYDNLQNHIQKKLTEEYQRCLTGMNQVLKLSWQLLIITTRIVIKRSMIIIKH